MKEFFDYFFGAGSEVEFTNFGFAHFAPILVAIGIIFAIFKCKVSGITFPGSGSRHHYSFLNISIASKGRFELHKYIVLDSTKQTEE